MIPVYMGASSRPSRGALVNPSWRPTTTLHYTAKPV